MVSATSQSQTANAITSTQLLDSWLGNRRLTRRTFDAFPEKELFSFSIGGMRPASALAQELLAIAGPGLREIVHGNTQPFSEGIKLDSKEDLLSKWDEATEEIISLWSQLPADAFAKEYVLFGMYPGSGWSSVNYFIENEVHHRAQAYVYLRALGIEPPFFWEK
jgi:uncharacterized damage-inducible protein DinB